MALNWMLARDAKSGSWVARKQIPARLRPAYTAAFGKGWAEKFARYSEAGWRSARCRRRARSPKRPIRRRTSRVETPSIVAFGDAALN